MRPMRDLLAEPIEEAEAFDAEEPTRADEVSRRPMREMRDIDRQTRDGGAL